MYHDKNTHTVTMIGQDGDEMEVFDNPGADRPELDSWGAAIRAARVRLGETYGWASAKITGPYGHGKQTVRMTAADVRADEESRLAEAARRNEEREAMYSDSDLETI